MPKQKMWVVVADGTRARVFTCNPTPRDLEPAFDHQFIGTNLPTRELGSDRPGRAFSSVGPGRSAMEPPTDPARHAKFTLAQAIVRKLESELNAHAFERLVVIAPPQMLGDLRSEMPATLRRTVVAELDKDLSKLPVQELGEHVENLLRP